MYLLCAFIRKVRRANSEFARKSNKYTANLTTKSLCACGFDRNEDYSRSVSIWFEPNQLIISKAYFCVDIFWFIGISARWNNWVYDGCWATFIHTHSLNANYWHLRHNAKVWLIQLGRDCASLAVTLNRSDFLCLLGNVVFSYIM